jgi:hypothetical protein
VCVSYFDFGHASEPLNGGVDSRTWASPFGGDEALAALNHLRVPEIEIVLTAAFHKEGSGWCGRSLLLIFRVEGAKDAADDVEKALSPGP